MCVCVIKGLFYIIQIVSRFIFQAPKKNSSIDRLYGGVRMFFVSRGTEQRALIFQHLLMIKKS